MKKNILLMLFCSFSLWAIDSKILIDVPNTPSPWIIRAYYDNQQQLQEVSEISDLWQINKKQKYAIIMIVSENEFKKVQSLNLKIRLDTKFQKKYVTDNKQLKSQNLNQGNDTINGYGCYSTVEGSFTRMQSLVNNHPSLAEIIDIGESWEKTMNANNGYGLKVLKITNQNISSDKPILFITSAIHAREYTTAELTTRFAEYLLSQYTTNSDVQWMLDHQEIQLLIHTNPDGRKKAETGILWRKNTNQDYCSPTSNNRGADLNRNYPFFWQNNNDQCSDVFPGANAESEPEVSSVMSYISSIYDDNRGSNINDAAPDDTPGVFLDIHSFSELVLWPWGFTSNDNPNINQYEAFGRRVAFYNKYTPEPITDLTTAFGGSVDSSYGELGIASLAFELGTDFFQDCDVFESKVLPDNLQALLYVSRVSRTPYISPQGPDIEELKVIPNFVLSNQQFSVSGIANDDRYNHSHGAQIIDQVQQVEIYIDDLPWDKLNAQTATAKDGIFDESIEEFKTQIDSQSLSIGEHIVYTVAQDSNGVAGAVYSKFLNVVEASQVGTLNGIVTDAITGVVIENVKLEINNSIAQSNASGQYSVLVLPTTGTLLATVNGYAKTAIDNVQIMQQQLTQTNVQLEPFCSIFTDDIENGTNGWSATSPWGIVTNQSNSPTHSWTDSPNGDYATGVNKSMTSADINIQGSDNFELSFNHLCDTEAGYDFGHVEVNFDNSGWQNVMSCAGESDWKNEVNSMPIPNNSQNMQLRFRLETDNFVNEDGWYIDDINVRVSGLPCRKVFDDVIFQDGFET